jgi:hypothetical protein
MRAILFVLCVVSLGTAQQAAKPLDACRLLSTREQYDNRIVTVSGYVEASYHVTMLTSADCKGGIALADSKSLPADPLYGVYHEGVQAKRVDKNARKFKVVVQGRFRTTLPKARIGGSQLVIMRLLDARFEDGS